MTQVIVFKNDIDGISVCFPTGEISIEQVLAKDCPPDAIIVDSSELPEADNDFFNAWELVEGKVQVNLSKAIELTKERLRAERVALLQAQDVLFQRALETGADTSAIVIEKQRLRDITKLADVCTNLEQLRNIGKA